MESIHGKLDGDDCDQSNLNANELNHQSCIAPRWVRNIMNFKVTSTSSTFTCCLLLLFTYCGFGFTKIRHGSRGFQFLLSNGLLSKEAMDSIDGSITKESTLLKRWTRSANELEGLTQDPGVKEAVVETVTEIDDATAVPDVTTTTMVTEGMIISTAEKVVEEEEDALLDSVCQDDIIINSPCYKSILENSSRNENSMCQMLIMNTMKEKQKLLCKLLKQSKSKGTKSFSNDNAILTRYLPPDYNRFEVPITNVTHHLPNGTMKAVLEPVECEALLYIREIRDLDELNEQITLDVDLVVGWIDGVILKTKLLKLSDYEKFESNEQRKVYLDPSVLQKIWSPDLYFEQMVSMAKPTLMGKSETIVLFPALGLFIYRTRALVKLFCTMEFYHYPADTQKCVFTLKSFSYDTKLFKAVWTTTEIERGVYLNELSDPNFDFQVASYSQEELAQNVGPGSPNASVANYSNLIFTLRARRKMSYHILQTYIPSMFFVIVTRMCFLIPVEMFEARVGIAMSTLLTTTSMFSSVRESTPIVSYVKAIDTWMAMCINFIFMALMAFIASAWCHRMLCKLEEEEGTLPKRRRRSIYGIREKPEESKKRYLRMAKIIDKYPPVLISIGFITFNILYWSWLIVDSQHFNWSVNSSINNVGN